jgi:hypothetical protein
MSGYTGVIQGLTFWGFQTPPISAELRQGRGIRAKTGKVIKLTTNLEPKIMAKNGSWVKSKEGWTHTDPASSRSFSGLKPGANNLKHCHFA